MFLLLIAFSSYAQKSEVREVAPFSEIGLSTAGVVYLTQGSTQKVELKGSSEILEKIETEVRGGKLIIKHEGTGWFNWSKNDDLEIYITINKIEGLSVSSSGKIIGQNKFKTDRLELSVSGSGKIEAQTDSDDLDISISGSGKIELGGTASAVEASISGSGKIRAENLKARSYKVRISGSGSCEVYAEESIDARISGSGSIYYKGEPKHINSSTSGSGRIKKM
ncbi:hypothetical protein C900_05496 [Fulvivirga imtechensis AK7]|uniref:Putative auto-transporter adhesin head GIN domain-containing protein n=1 Tax=Fulvivirga imtechensis AK7 TaxID=1237149 RepID=L8JNZ9_9BACT|nr:hypothetical protein C900_05496 [Fulvivirga imtechensis AK7]